MNNIDLYEGMYQFLNIKLSKDQLDQFDQYYKLLIEKNKQMNLTAITKYDEVILKHFIDSLTIVRNCDLSKEISLIDMGTGAGFPGIPLKIVFPNLNILLVDSLNKRVNFLKEIINELHLKDISAIHGRAEEYGRKPEYREKYDICVSRAVANLSTLSEYCLPYVKLGGLFISYKADNIHEELKKSENPVKILGGKIENIDSFILPKSDMKRTLITIKKVKKTPNKYPRGGGKPKKEPLI